MKDGERINPSSYAEWKGTEVTFRSETLTPEILSLWWKKAAEQGYVPPRPEIKGPSLEDKKRIARKRQKQAKKRGRR
jgi:hypothetical protein